MAGSASPLPCGSDWKAKIQELWAKYQNVVKTVQFNGTMNYPDGDGNVQITYDGEGFATTQDLDDAVNGLESEIATKQPIGDYATNTALQTGLATKQPVGDYATNSALQSGLAGKQDVGDYATNTALTQGLATKQPVGDYATRSELTQGLATKQPVGDYVTNSALNQALAGKQDTLIAGSNISIVDNVISATGGGGGGVTVDSALSTSSTNPVENRVITNALNGKQASGDYATNTALTQGLAGKQDTLSSAQQNAVNSGITSAKVSQYDGYASLIAGKQNAIQTAQVTVPASGGTVTVPGMTASAFVIVSPAPSSFDVYATAGCRCTAQANGSLTFAVDETASASMTVNVGWFA